ncbi:unnamed protein product [Chrysodeixis includens]|uniref:Leucine-rich repeat-containing protein 71 n=1 Tax=Chrysodeixis includens TaxID=689277 RepID=A0A9P0BU94_CHRIL|nr:unnamed protein product [Chrysodeixis includens]
MIRALSVKSLKSDKSDTFKSIQSSSDDGKSLDFDQFIGASCKAFDCPVAVAVGKEIDRDAFVKSGKKLETKLKRRSVVPHIIEPASSDEDTQTEKSLVHDDQTLLIMTYYDILNRMTEIHMTKYHYHPIPWILMRLISLILPLHKHLQKFIIKSCKIDMYTIYELSKILPNTNITEVCLDHSPLREGNYDILLSDSTSVRSLSLARCNINDIVCERIAARLKFLEPAERTLIILNLSTNYITDKGAKHLGVALRTNRHLRYLNLAGNQITDTGANFIFEVLIEFPLTSEEITEKRKRYFDYLNKKQTLIETCLCELKMDEISLKKGSKKPMPMKINKPNMKKGQESWSDEVINAKIDLMLAETLGPFEDPFSQDTSKVVNGHCFNVGNLILCYLNLAYNNLSFLSIQKLIGVLLYQRELKCPGLCGLLNVIVEGNYLPKNCKELDNMNNILLRQIMRFGNRPAADRKRKSTVITSQDKKLPLSSG